MTRLREYRESAGLSQVELAEKAGVSRQLVGAAESGRNLPRVDAAIALAGALGVPVEDVFPASAPPCDVLTGEPIGDGRAVRAGRVGSKVVAAPFPASPLRWGSLDGVVTGGSLTPVAGLRNGLVVAGCEPALDLLEDQLRRRGTSALSVMTSSRGAIAALQAGRVHAAVVHGPALARADEMAGVARFRLASWEVGLADAVEAPSGWFDAALSGQSPVVQREPGAGVQQAFESAVHGDAARVPGPRVNSHHESAVHALYAGIPAVTIAPAAVAVGAQFVALDSHDTEVWIDPRWFDDRVVTEALDVLLGREFRATLARIGGYDLSAFGTKVS
ncbi:MAG: helix-turn-helix domain-containing protein [Acidimicrobiia bacterium]|nr:helix-turn-helix domain-containing protein [Acidimicrobiia bacterium]